MDSEAQEIINEIYRLSLVIESAMRWSIPHRIATEEHHADFKNLMKRVCPLQTVWKPGATP